MKKILVIPSWYPSTDDPGLGTFFREQAALFTEDFDIRIMAGHLNRNISRRQKLQNTLRFALTKRAKVQEKNEYFLAPPQVYGFAYSRGMNRYAIANFRMAVKAYVTYFEKYILPDWQPDLIHAQNTNMAGIVARYISEKFKIPYIITDHHHLNPGVPDYIQKEIKQALLYSKTNCFVSEWQYRTYLLLDVEIKGEVIGNPIDSDFFKPIEKSTNIFVITHTSNADYPKDIATLSSALIRFFNANGPTENVVINLVGFPETVINKLKAQWHIYDWFRQVKFYPQLSKAEYVKVVQQSHVFLMTSVFESFGLAPLEAMLCGVPVVTTGNGGIDEYLIQRINGIKVPLKDADSLAQSLSDIYRKSIQFDPEEVRNSVLNKFSINEFKQKVRTIYSTYSDVK